MNSPYTQIQDLLSANRPSEAEKLLAIQLQNHSSGQLHSLYVLSLLRQGKEQQAIVHLQTEIAKDQDDAVQLIADLAGIYLKLEKFELAQKHFTLALQRAPNSDQLWHLLGITQFRSGNKSQAYASFAKAEQHDVFKSQVNLAEQAIEQGDKETCSTILNSVLQKFPAHPQANFLLATILIENGHTTNAAEHVGRALNYSPYHQNLWQLMLQIQVQLCDMQAALQSAQKLVEFDPANHNFYLLLADIQQNSGKIQSALTSYQKALELDAEPATCLLQIAHLQQSLGNDQSAISNYRSCLSDLNHASSALWGLSTISSYTESIEERELLSKLQLEPNISAEQACQASFALARNKEKQQDFTGAFRQYSQANLLKADKYYNPQQSQQKYASIKNTFPTDIFHFQTGITNTPAIPIFIVGLPRSGSTLTEQILASHSKVEATMELKVMPAVARRAFIISCEKTGNNSGNISCLSANDLASLGEYYLSLSEVYRCGTPYFIDKLPPNFQHIGLIKKILPEAIIIDTRRSPMAWGMAVFRQYFAQGHDYSYDLSHIAHAYHNYLDLMNHWNKCLGDNIYKIEYEKLVGNPEEQIKALLTHCQLPFESTCLTPHHNKRYVRTASSDQVRKPIYQSAIDSWKKYQSELSMLQKAYLQYGIKT